MGINSNNPFGSAVGWDYPQSPWATGQSQGGTDSFDEFHVGDNNTADNWHSNTGSPYDSSNNGSGNTGILGDPTVINTAVTQNATFVSDNIFTGEGSVGMFGRSRGAGFTPQGMTLDAGSSPGPNNDWSVGVLGQSSKGCGVYGLATDDDPTLLLPGTSMQPSHGIGVVGRSVGGEASSRCPSSRTWAQPA
jgi:hypothetical protein